MIGSATLDSSGNASITVASASLDQQPIQAEYTGDANFADTWSVIISQITVSL